MKTVERGRCLGSEEFRQELLAAAPERIGATHYGAERRETEAAKAQRLVQEEEEMDQLGGKEEELAGGSKGDQQKVRMAARWRRETTMTLKWIAERLALGSWTNVSTLLGVERVEATTHFIK